MLVEYDEEFHATKGALKGLAVKERALEKIVEERRAALEEKISAQGEANFANYLQQHEEIFTSVKKTYGKGVQQKMKGDQKKEFVSMVQT